MARALFWSITALGLILLAAGFLGRVHPLGDSLAVFRGPIALAGVVWLGLGCVGGAIPSWRRAAVLFALPLVALGTVIAPHVSPENEGGPRVLYQKNMFVGLRSTEALEADIRAVAPDFLTLQEVSPRNAALLANLSDLLPSQYLCPQGEWGVPALASRWPKVDGSEICDLGLAAFQVETPQGMLTLVSLHMIWPFPYGQAEQFDRIAPILAGLPKPVVIGGDFNMVRWGSVPRRLGQLTDTDFAGRAHRSFRLRRTLIVAIDHVLVARGLQAQTITRPLLGSDHLALVTRF